MFFFGGKDIACEKFEFSPNLQFSGIKFNIPNLDEQKKIPITELNKIFLLSSSSSSSTIFNEIPILLLHGFSLHARHISLTTLHCISPLISTIRFPLLLHTHHLTTTHHHHHHHHQPILPSSCTNLQSLKQTHASYLCNGFKPISFAPKLITLYTEFSDLNAAVSVFKSLPEPNTFFWNLIIKAHVDSGLFDTSLSLFLRMRESGVFPDNFTFPILNRAISSFQSHLSYGEMIHGIAIQMGFGVDLYFCNTLIEVYVKNCSIDSARSVFDEMPDRDLVTWTSMISGYVSNRNIEDGFRLFRRMRVEDFEPNLVTLMILLRACSVSKNLSRGRELHGYVIKKRLESNLSVHNSILTMYSKTGSFEEVEILFNEIEERDVVSWNIMMSTYSSDEESSRVAKSFYIMQTEVIPTVETLTLVISAFAKSGNLLQGEKFHGYMIKTGFCDIILQTSLINFYVKCGEIEISTRLFKELDQKSNITWSAMMSGYIQNGCFIEAIELFREMQMADYNPGVDVLRSLVLAYTHSGALQLGKGVHGFVLRNIIYRSEEDNRAMETSILNMYAKCGSIVSARRSFEQMVIKDLVAWSSMIEGYSNHGCGLEALKLFDQMQVEGIRPNNITILSLLSACSHSGLVNEGYKIFNHMSSTFGIKPDLNHYTCMVDLLGRSGRLQEALNIIEEMAVVPDSRIWGALVAASMVYSNTELGDYAAKRLLELEPDNNGYRVLMSNIHASAERWDEVENVRNVMSEKDMKNKKKKPGWSCIETRGGGFHGFVAGDDSHPQVSKIYEILGCLSRIVEEFESSSYFD